MRTLQGIPALVPDRRPGSRCAALLLFGFCSCLAAMPDSPTGPDAAGAARAEAGATKLSLVSTVWPPFTDVAGRPRLASDLVHEALARAGVEAETAIVADALLESSMRDGSYVGSGALWHSEERAQFLLYSEPYMENRLVLVGRKGADVSATSFAELDGKRVALVRGYAYGPAVDGATHPTFVRGESLEENLQSVLDGDADYTVIDELVIRHIVKQYPEDAAARFEIGSTPLLERSLHFALRKDVPGAESIVARFDEKIREMLFDGTYNRILRLDWIRTDVDGDGQSELVLEGDRAGVAPPTDAYEVLSSDETPETPPKKLRFFVGGELYRDWEQVPERFKVPPPRVGADPESAPAPLVTIRF